MKKLSVLFFVAIVLLTFSKDAYSQWHRSDQGRAFFFLYTGIYPSENTWGYETPYYLARKINWDVTEGTYLPAKFIEVGFELNRPLWAMQLNFGVKEEEIYVINTNTRYQYNSNYCTIGLMFFPLKQQRVINPFVLAKAGIVFQADFIQDNARLLSFGGGVRMYIVERFACDLIVEKQHMKYKRIPCGDDILGYFQIHPVRLSIGLMYEF